MQFKNKHTKLISHKKNKKTWHKFTHEDATLEKNLT